MIARRMSAIDDGGTMCGASIAFLYRARSCHRDARRLTESWRRGGAHLRIWPQVAHEIAEAYGRRDVGDMEGAV